MSQALSRYAACGRVTTHVLEAAPLGKAPLERRVVTVHADVIERVEFEVPPPK